MSGYRWPMKTILKILLIWDCQIETGCDGVGGGVDEKGPKGQCWRDIATLMSYAALTLHA